MQRFALTLLLAGAALSTGVAAFAQGTPQTLSVMKIDVVKGATKDALKALPEFKYAKD